MTGYIKIFLTVLLFTILIPSGVFAIELTKTNFDYNESMYFIGDGGPWVVYDTESGLSKGGRGSYSDSDDIGIILNSGKTYSVVETTEDGICEDNGFTYTQCKNSEFFVGEFIFSINLAPSGGGFEENGPPISAPSTVYNGEDFTPVCNSEVSFFRVVGLYDQVICGESINFGTANNITYEIQAMDAGYNYVEPSVFVHAVYSLQASSTRSRARFYNPLVSIFLPKLNFLFSTSTLIDYNVTDQNDLGSTDEKTSKGLGDKPVSIFYTDKSFDWNIGSVLVNPDYKNLIVKDLPAIGQYNWSIKNLIPGKLYRVIVNAIDNAGFIGESVSDFFSVDFTAPVFNVKTDPTIIKKGDVKITVESSEDLSKAPIVSVIQRAGMPVFVAMKGEKDTYEGIYTVQEGYDGTAKIEIEGTDLAENIGTEIISGGTFSVGVNPPVKPQITSDINKSVTYDEFTSLSGVAREDTEVILFVNGTTTAITKPNTKGNFTFDKIKLNKTKNRGVNYLSIISRDILGTASEPANIEIKYNALPKISIIKPTDNILLSNQTDIIVKGTDENLDTLLYTYQIISLSDYDPKALNNIWTTIASNVPDGNIVYDTTEVDNGDYLIRALVSDGYETATSTSVSVKIKNTVPYFRFENGRKTITKESEVIISGKAIVPAAGTSTIKNIYYSLDGGKKWITVTPDNTGSATERKFSVVFKDLKEGIYPIMWRIKDSNNFISRGSHTIVVDKTAPLKPIIKNPKNNLVITNDNDENLKKDGVQISVKGTAEPGSVVGLMFNNQTITTKTLSGGEFFFSEITFDYKGKQDLQFVATDEAGNKSAAAILTLTYNNPPTIIFVNPKPFRGLSGKALLSWNITDIDGDAIKNVEISYRKYGEKFKTLVTNAEAKGTYTWNTLSLPESSDYELKITATDSITPVSAVTNFFIDRTSPALSSFSLNKEMIDKKVKFSGKGAAVDTVSGIEYVEYSVKSENDKEGGPWYKGIITKGYLQKQASFIIKYPNDLSDNTYTVYARAVDAAGNISNELSQDIYIDRTAPRIGSFFITKNSLELTPDQDGNISFYKNSPFIFAVSMEKDTKIAHLTIGNKNIKLKRNTTSGLWEATSTVDTELAQNILITAEDDSGNVTKNKKIGAIAGINSGNVVILNNNEEEFISGVQIHVYKLNDNTGQYDKFTPTINGVASSIETNEDGKYELVLPAGTYHLIAVKSGFKVIKKDITLSRTEIVNDSFVTEKISGIEKIINDIFNYWFY